MTTVFYDADVFERDVDYTVLPYAEKLQVPRKGVVSTTGAKLVGMIGAVTLSGALGVSVAPSSVAGSSTVAMVRDLSTVSGSSIPFNTLPASWRVKADRFSRLFREVPENQFEREFDINHDI
jgi:hypothetical protein